ncbi:MAG: iron-sulfur cluster insertion protein ErpA [Alphaproteobacteria bacterium]|nr:iron-sulfur cluster insertion protein ErpA [Alphaproteobacteria bacterium]
MNEASQETHPSPEQGATGTAETAERAVSLSAAAAKRVLTLMESEEHKGQNLRIAVSGGGCQGFSYGFSFDDAVNGDDHTFTRDGATLVVDDVSLDLLAGSEVDFVEDLMGAYFRVTNPNADSTCGCGTSFSV